MGLGSYTICEFDSLYSKNLAFQNAFRDLDNELIQQCEMDWDPKKFGFLTPSSQEFGRTTILPALFDDLDGNQMAHWRQEWDETGHQTIITGTRAGNTLPEDFKAGWMGLAFPNKNQFITEIKFQIGDRKYGRINLEEMHSYRKPALVFEKGFTINEEQSFDLYAYIEGPLPENGPGGEEDTIYQRVVMLGASYFRRIDKVLGNTGAAI